MPSFYGRASHLFQTPTAASVQHSNIRFASIMSLFSPRWFLASSLAIFGKASDTICATVHHFLKHSSGDSPRKPLSHPSFYLYPLFLKAASQKCSTTTCQIKVEWEKSERDGGVSWLGGKKFHPSLHWLSHGLTQQWADPNPAQSPTAKNKCIQISFFRPLAPEWTNLLCRPPFLNVHDWATLHK